MHLQDKGGRSRIIWYTHTPTAAPMTGKIIIVAGLFLLATQVQGKALQGNNGISGYDGLNAVRTLVIKTITKYHSQVKEANEEYLNKITKYSEDIQENEETSNMVKLRGESYVKTVNEMAEKLVEKGKQDSKPMSYFQCVEKNRGQAEMEVRMQMDGYKYLMQKAQKAAMSKAQSPRVVLRAINHASDGLLEDYKNEVNACQNVECLEEVVGRSWRAFKLSKRIMSGFMVSFMKEYQMFFREAYAKFNRVDQLMDEDALKGIGNMNKC